MRGIAALGLIALLATACGEDPGPGPETSSGEAATSAGAVADAPATDRPWVARFEVGSGEVPSGVAYVRFTPDTGESQVTTIPQPPLDFEPNPLTLVDAGRTWAVVANAASLREESRGTAELHSLTGGKARRLDLRELTGEQGLRPIGWAFDPAAPGLLRVLDRSGRLFEVDVEAGTATEGERVDAPKGYALAPAFDSATGMPLLRDNSTYEYEPGGEYDAGGVTVVDAADEPRTGVCTGKASLSGALVDDAGTTWSACLQDTELRLASRADGATDWSVVGTPARDVPREVATMTWVLPPL